MTSSSAVYRIGTRSSNLALFQARQTVAEFARRFPGLAFEFVPLNSPGDRDRATDLRQSPADFFTRDLDDAVRSGTLDCAVHSAKDVPDPVPDGLDWVWLPWRAEPRDALVVRQGTTVADLPNAPRIGVSSERRAAYCTKRFPDGAHSNLRGNIEERLRQLDAGDVDLIVMAAAALERLDLAGRISELIPLNEMPVPEGQGRLCLTFRQGDPTFLRLRALFTTAVRFVGAGIGTASNATMAAVSALQNCDICFHDSLMDQNLLSHLPAQARAIYVGKRAGAHYRQQTDINTLLADAARKGYRVVRLKGGDPAIFGRLAEELEALGELNIPCRIIPGLSSLNVLSAGSGILLTRRGGANGFTVLTPRKAGGGMADISASERSRYPVVAYMSVKACGDVCAQLVQDGWDDDMPAAMVFGVGSDQEFTVRGTLLDLPDKVAETSTDLPGLLIAGAEADREPLRCGPLRGRRVLLTCSEAILGKASREVVDRGGVPVPLPMLRLVPTEALRETMPRLDGFDWLVVTSPSSVRILMADLLVSGTDLRRLPKIATCGTGTSAELQRHGITPDLCPDYDFGATALLEEFGTLVPEPASILRVRSNKAGPALADQLRKAGHRVEECIAYTTEAITHDRLPEFDALCFASSSAVENFVAAWGTDAFAAKPMVCIGKPTAVTLAALGKTPDRMGTEATMAGCIEALAAHILEGEVLALQEAAE